MARILSLLVAIISVFVSTANAGQQTRNVLSPTQVSSPPTGPTSTTLPFEVAWPVTCPCTLHVVNGVPGSGPLSTTRVLAGSAWVDGVLVMTPLQISQLNANATAAVNLPAGTHDVRLELLGPATSFVTVRVSGTITTADLAVARGSHTATLMPNGSVMVAGGEGASTVLSSTERITANANHVEPAAPLLTARAGHAAALVPELTSLFGLFDSSLTETIRDELGIDDVVSPCSTAYAIGGYAADAVVGTAALLRGLAAAGATKMGRFLNTNRYARVGPGRMPANGPLPASTHAPRLSIGQGPNNPHFDLRIRGID